MLAALSLAACKPEDPPAEDEPPPPPIAAEDAAQKFAETICAGLYECECESAEQRFADQGDCVDRFRARYTDLIDSTLLAGGTWDDECAGQRAAAWSKWGCLGPAMAARAASFDPLVCPVLKGVLEIDETACLRNELGDQCGPDLMCVYNVCEPAPELPVSIGEPCRHGGFPLPCEDGAWCTFNSDTPDGICQALPNAGDPCHADVGDSCGPTSRGLICDDSVCVAAPGPGEPCYNGTQCEPSSYCDGGKDFTCQPRFELGDFCGANTVCPVDATCSGNICVAVTPQICGLAYLAPSSP
jgi:hypothetical protein